MMGMSPSEMIAEWKRGCSCAGPFYDRMIRNPEGTSKPEECLACTEALIRIMGETIELMLPELRKLRLWHWKESQAHRLLEQYWGKCGVEHMQSYAEGMVGVHIKAVQALNGFFPSGDTAEQDADG